MNVVRGYCIARSLLSILRSSQLWRRNAETTLNSVAREPPLVMAVSWYVVSFLAASALGASIARKFSSYIQQ